MRSRREAGPDFLLCSRKGIKLRSRHGGIKYSPRGLVGNRCSRRKRQPSAPELPGAVADPARLGAQHDFHQAWLADNLLQQKDVVIGSEIHRLRDDATLGMRASVARLPPKVFAAECGDRVPESVICCHTLQYPISYLLSTQAPGRGPAPQRRGTMPDLRRCSPSLEGFAMQTFLGMILGALLLGVGVYAYDSMQTSTVANGEVAQTNRTIVNWDVASTDWDQLKRRAHDDWIRLSSK